MKFIKNILPAALALTISINFIYAGQLETKSYQNAAKNFCSNFKDQKTIDFIKNDLGIFVISLTTIFSSNKAFSHINGLIQDYNSCYYALELEKCKNKSDLFILIYNYHFSKTIDDLVFMVLKEKYNLDLSDFKKRIYHNSFNYSKGDKVIFKGVTLILLHTIFFEEALELSKAILKILEKTKE